MSNFTPLGKSVTQIKALTNELIDDCQYWNSSAGWSLNRHNQSQGQAAIARKKAKLHSLTKGAVRLSFLVDGTLGSTLRDLCDATASVIACCDHFPRDAAWPGDGPRSRQLLLIAKARTLLKGRP